MTKEEKEKIHVSPLSIAKRYNKIRKKLTVEQKAVYADAFCDEILYEILYQENSNVTK